MSNSSRNDEGPRHGVRRPSKRLSGRDQTPDSASSALHSPEIWARKPASHLTLCDRLSGVLGRRDDAVVFPGTVYA
jgi:hypothetical protein